MKYLLLLVLPLLLDNEPEKPAVKESVKQAAENPIDKENCTYKGIPLYGKVKVVNSGADFKVFVTNVTLQDVLEVQTVTCGAFRCGQWQFVNAGQDFTIQYVHRGSEDFQVRFVSSGPGIVH